ncbi:TetR/AcrR family transcriptional regulator, partial [Halorubrum ezzemoulense]|nr:TetR/AcrR family transcriptional regulator [Halorubrum ezzemoulense]MDB2239694.1 TetR/AcrR family transcriptional regulator [Halorubrum ezzemoulense]
MARFTDEDRERIRKELIEAGHKLFAQFGFDRTRVSDIT